MAIVRVVVDVVVAAFVAVLVVVVVVVIVVICCWYALTAIRGIGRRISNIVCKKCDIDLKKRAGELTTDEVNKIVAVVSTVLLLKNCRLKLCHNNNSKQQ
ncbi:unnamed protein product [Polarella glacialis]|uniref:Uncharacterized protein n=1 Tax=Polarella glacialis TaxID=89957 RepID=A0A813F5J4_POLGL|nr:unnamed protein product [Polarella glacialis]